MPFPSPLIAMLVALGSPQGLENRAGVPQADVARHGRPDVEALSASGVVWPGFEDGRRVPVSRQVRIERRVILRISPQPGNTRRDLLAQLPPRAAAPRLVERPHGKCLDASEIVGVSDRGSRLVIYLRDRQIITAKLEKACSPRDFYLGFYVERSDDGKLCVDRDRLMSRAGARCRISKFNRLVTSNRDR
ncbi:hypothetical protein [Erythrobacter aureus]|uniref:hypothetical protein n=1 Tax=Erythrobacter aureus TaxID=2182384 RepID=UPI003A914214